MLIGEIPPSPWDLHFSVGPIPVRVSPYFWLLGLMWVGGRDPQMLIMSLLALFLSILIHELGHAMAFAHFGVASHVLLYLFGGMAIPETSYRGMGRATSLRPLETLIVAAAGPAFQMLVGVLMILGLALGGFEVPFRFPWIDAWLPTGAQRSLPDVSHAFFSSFLHVSILWAIFNLAPVFPLDGGQISRQLMILSGQSNAIYNSSVLSIATGALIAMYGLSSGNIFLAIMFGLLAMSNYQTLQGNYHGRGPWSS
ncbi:MAG: hypothetical protein O3C60_00435 [Planctomycetota bacterium]|nr:hypothetical protein [Planctomycetota bacterium]